jgi:hypothetical protein
MPKKKGNVVGMSIPIAGPENPESWDSRLKYLGRRDSPLRIVFLKLRGPSQDLCDLGPKGRMTIPRTANKSTGFYFLRAMPIFVLCESAWELTDSAIKIIVLGISLVAADDASPKSISNL